MALCNHIHNGRITAEICPSNRTTCDRCRQTIKAGDVRIGIPSHVYKHMLLDSHFHARCALEYFNEVFKAIKERGGIG